MGAGKAPERKVCLGERGVGVVIGVIVEGNLQILKRHSKNVAQENNST